MNKETIILAGGLGTRLRSVVADIPKCMAPVAGKPFLHYVIACLEEQGVDRFIFSLGYKHELIESYLNDAHPLMFRQSSVEAEPMGTGGAIALACNLATEKNVMIINADTLFKIDADKLFSFHDENDADCTLCLKPMENFERYGVVEINADGSISSFKEKQPYQTGLINGGIYALNRERFLQESFPQKFSFENDYLEKQVDKRKLFGLVQDEYFIDIGVPEDYERAGLELRIKS